MLVENESDISPVLLNLQVSIFLIFLIFYKRTKSSAPHGGRENVKMVITGLKKSNKKHENILKSENVEKNMDEVLSDTETRSEEEEEVSFDPLSDYDEAGCPKVPFVFSGMTGKIILHILNYNANENTKKGNIFVLINTKVNCCYFTGRLGNIMSTYANLVALKIRLGFKFFY